MRLVHRYGALTATTVLLATAAAASAAPADWADLIGSPSAAQSPTTVIVVLDAPPAALRPAATGSGDATIAATSESDRLLARITRRGLHVSVLRRFTRVILAVEATVPADERWALAHAPGVRGVYPVRSLVATSIASDAAAAIGAAAAPVHSGLAGDGAGVVIAVLDGPVDDTTASLAGKVDRAAPLPAGDTSTLDHGTAMASIAAGAAGPAGLGGVARAARILSIPILHPGADGALTGTTGDLLAGLELAADPNGDGNLSDRVRVVLAAVNAPFAGFDDAPEAQAIAAISALGAVVVTPAGNDGPGAGGRGTIGSPGAAPAALTVGATDGRSLLPSITVNVAGLGYRAAFDTSLGGLVSPPPGVTLPLRGIVGYARATPDAGAALADYLGVDGGSTVQGAAVLVPRDGGDVRRKLAAAATAGAAALLLYGDDPLPAGALGADDRLPVPVINVPASVALAASRRLATGENITIQFGAVTLTPSAAVDTIAPFSATGLTELGAVKPDIVLPGVAVSAAQPLVGWVSVSGTSVAAAQAAGLVAVLSAAHPDWTSAALRSSIVSTGRLVADATATVAAVGAQGGGEADANAASATVLDLQPATLTFGVATAGVPTTTSLQVTNRSGRAESVTLGFQRDAASPNTSLGVTVEPGAFVLGPHATVRLPVTVTVDGQAPSDGVVGGWIVVNVPDGPSQHVPFAIIDGAPDLTSLVVVTPAAGGVDVRVGAVSLPVSGGLEVHSVAMVTVDVVRGGRVLSHVYAARDVLPGRFRLRLRPVDRHGRHLPSGRYAVLVSVVDRNGRVERVEQPLPWR